MVEETGTFRVDVELENPAAPGPRHIVHAAMIDTGAELSWFPASILDSRRSESQGRPRAQATHRRWSGARRNRGLETGQQRNG